MAQPRVGTVLIAIDTNILVRLVVRDDDEQLKRARSLVVAGPVFVSLICLLETIWVIESRFGWGRDVIYRAVRASLDVRNMVMELEELAFWALDRFAQGADIADMLLLVAARDQEKFVTFDRRLSRKAGQGMPIAVETLA